MKSRHNYSEEEVEILFDRDAVPGPLVVYVIDIMEDNEEIHSIPTNTGGRCPMMTRADRFLVPNSKLSQTI